MNKSDRKLLIILSIIICISFLILILNQKKANYAKVYYENTLILSIDLNIDKDYTVNGALGAVIIEVKNNKIRVKQENSPKHICSKQGFVKSSIEPIICLPNKIIIELTNNEEIDGVVK